MIFVLNQALFWWKSFYKANLEISVKISCSKKIEFLNFKLMFSDCFSDFLPKLSKKQTNKLYWEIY